MLSTGGTPAPAHSMSHAAVVRERQALAAVLDGPVDAGVAGLVRCAAASRCPRRTRSGGQIGP